MAKVELSEESNIDIHRYQRNYPNIVQVKGTPQQSSPGSIYSEANMYDQLYSDIITYFRQNSEADTFLRQQIEARETSRREV